MANHGFDPDAWARAKTEAIVAMVERAKVRGKITYSELVGRIDSITIDAHDPRIAMLLEEISIAEAEAGRGMLTAVVVHKVGDMMPGPGFFDLAKRLGRNTRDKEACWVKEFNKVYSEWS
jgi:hypothetical protein